MSRKPRIKDQFKVPKEGLDLENTKLRRVRKYTKNAKQKNKKILSEVLAQDPTANARTLAKKMRLGRNTILNYIKELRSEGDAGAIKRIEIYQAWKDNAQKVQKEVLEYWQNYEYSSENEVAEALDLPLEEVRRHKRALLKKDPDCIKSQGITVQQANKELMVAKYFQKNPLATYTQASRDLGLAYPTIRRYSIELSDKINAETNETYGLIGNWYAEQVMATIEKCDKKFNECKSPTHGSRWIELRLMALRMLAKKFRLEQPDVNVNISMDVSKEERDAAADAIAKTMAYSNDLELVKPIKQIGHKALESAGGEDSEVIDI